jgi:adenylylsulfate kinase
MLNGTHAPMYRCTCPGATVWVTGACTADRLAAAYALAERLTAEGRRVEVLDRYDDLEGDPRRTGLLAEVLARNGIVAIVPCTTRGVTAVRDRHAASGTRYVEIDVDEPAGQEYPVATMYGLVTAGD